MPSMLEVFAVVTGIATVALAARGHIANWPIGIVSSAVFLVVFLEAGLYADALLQGAVRRARRVRLVGVAV